VSGPSSSSGAPPSGAVTGDAVDAVQQALGAEHAAVWLYGLTSAFLPQANQPAAAEAAAAHRDRRDATEALLRASGVTPQPAAPAYIPPNGVTDAATAIAALAAVESDGCVAWRAVLERTDNGDLRRTALDALTAAAVRATKWRLAGGQSPATPPLPGAPS
jgi:hypothetical protein